MAKYVLCVVMLVAVVSARRLHHQKFTHKVAEYELKTSSKGDYSKVACSFDRGLERDKIIAESRCGEPRAVFVPLVPKGPHEEVSPGAVWVKRCVGLCDFDAAGSCVPTAVTKREIPVRVYNAETDREMCASYTVEEHLSCGCCNKNPSDCEAPKIYVPRKCACQCPNTTERKECLRKVNKRWNRSKCVCEEKRRMRV